MLVTWTGSGVGVGGGSGAEQPVNKIIIVTTIVHTILFDMIVPPFHELFSNRASLLMGKLLI